MWKISLLLCLLLSPLALAQDDQQTALVRRVFQARRAQWPQILAQNRELLNDTFFEKCQARIDWDLQHQMRDDAVRFAILLDYAAELTGRPAGHLDKLI